MPYQYCQVWVVADCHTDPSNASTSMSSSPLNVNRTSPFVKRTFVSRSVWSPMIGYHTES